MTKHRGTENKPYIEGMRLLRRSNAAQPHDPRPARERSRNDARRRAIGRSKGEE